jgi:CubicO group peptidase (beta-lactamase class C family)
VLDIIASAITARVTPAAVIEVGSAAGVRWQHAAGALTYALDAPPCVPSTIFDLASLTKVIATTSLAMRAHEQDSRWLDTPVAALEPSWRGDDRRHVTVRHLLAHASGLPPHVKLYERAQDRAEARALIASTPLAYPPGTMSQYSDLGFMLLGWLIESALGDALDQLFAPIAAHCGDTLLFTPPANLRDRIAPTELDPWRGRLIQGEVHDENAAQLGGVAGHAGLFGTAAAVGAFGAAVLRSFREPTWLATPDTMALFARKTDVPGSSRALGWDTMLPTSSCGSHFSAHAIGHTGFTGTTLWLDPALDVYVVLLTNRVHPTREGDGIQALRRDVHDAVLTSLGH